MAEDALKIKLASEEVRLGSAATSAVTIDITNTAAGAVTQVLYLLIPESFVDADHVSAIKFGPATLTPVPVADAPDGMTKYQLGATRGVVFDHDQTITLDLLNITARTEGPQTLQLLWGTRGQELKSTDITVTVLGADDVPRIVSFEAKNSVVNYSGKPPVELSWETSADSVVSLFRFDKQLLPIDGKRSAPTHERDYQDKTYYVPGLYPYRLEVTAKGKTISRTIFVRIQEAGWNRIDCDQGAPMNILSDGGNRLYGVFNSFWGSAIYPLDPAAGSMGTQNEMCKDGNVPEVMAKSPAAFFKGRVVLVGGSQVDASVFSNQVHAYDPKEERWEDLSENVPWSARMGHAITAYDGLLWVSGGVDANGNTLSDVYSTQDGKTWQKATDLPQPMCFHSLQGCAVNDPASGQSTAKLWLYGGLNSPLGQPYTSMWSALPGQTWTEMEFYISTNKTSPDPGFGAPFGAALATTLDDSGGTSLRVIATYQLGNADLSSGMYSLQGTGPANLVKNGDALNSSSMWKVQKSTSSLALPFQLCAATFNSDTFNYIFVQSILSDLATETLTFHVT